MRRGKLFSDLSLCSSIPHCFICTAPAGPRSAAATVSSWTIGPTCAAAPRGLQCCRDESGFPAFRPTETVKPLRRFPHLVSGPAWRGPISQFLGARCGGSTRKSTGPQAPNSSGSCQEAGHTSAVVLLHRIQSVGRGPYTSTHATIFYVILERRTRLRFVTLSH